MRIFIPGYICVSVLFFILPASSLLADAVLLRNGSRLEGQILGQDRTHVRFHVKNGKIMLIQKSDVQRLQYAEIQMEPEPKEESKKSDAEERADETKKLEIEEQQRAEKQKEEQRLAEIEAKRKQEEARKAAELAEKERIRKSRSQWSPVWRSALLPGWGMQFVGKTKEAKIYGSIFAVTFANAYWMRTQALESKRTYEQASLFSKAALAAPNGLPLVYFVDANSNKRFRRSVERYNLSFEIMSIVYLVQLTHAFAAGREYVASPVVSLPSFQSLQSVAATSSVEMRLDFHF
ncbi:MAG: hypothetical protein K8S54_14165 [Spirochaetia bacterium]|nr:hypothetical protein [Spirochaetia bacterium]